METEVAMLTAKIERIAIRLLAKYTPHDWEFRWKEGELKAMLATRLDRIFCIDVFDSLNTKNTSNEFAKVRLDQNRINRILMTSYTELIERIPKLYPEGYPKVNPVYLI
jgi:hypothetical protein